MIALSGSTLAIKTNKTATLIANQRSYPLVNQSNPRLEYFNNLPPPSPMIDGSEVFGTSLYVAADGMVLRGINNMIEKGSVQFDFPVLQLIIIDRINTNNDGMVVVLGFDGILRSYRVTIDGPPDPINPPSLTFDQESLLLPHHHIINLRGRSNEKMLVAIADNGQLFMIKYSKQSLTMSIVELILPQPESILQVEVKDNESFILTTTHIYCYLNGKESVDQRTTHDGSVINIVPNIPGIPDILLLS